MANRRSYMLGIIASVQIEGGHLDAAVSSLEGALTTSRTLGIAFYDAEISRLQDRCLLTEGKARGETAEELHWRTVPLGPARDSRLKSSKNPYRDNADTVSLPSGARVRATPPVAVGPQRTTFTSPLWTLESLRFGPDDAAANADRGENHDPRGGRSG